MSGCFLFLSGLLSVHPHLPLLIHLRNLICTLYRFLQILFCMSFILHVRLPRLAALVQILGATPMTLLFWDGLPLLELFHRGALGRRFLGFHL